MLGGNPYDPKPHLDLKGASKTPVDHTKLSEGHDQDTFNVRSSEQTQPTTPDMLQDKQATADKEMHDLASKLAKDAEIASAPSSEVNGNTTVRMVYDMLMY